MRATVPEFSPATLEVLTTVGDRLHRVGPGSQFEMFSIMRVATENLARVDAFYIALYRSPGRIDLPYICHRGRYVGTDQLLYSDGSLARWVQDHLAPYEYRHDNGHLVRRGLPIDGDGAPTLDAVAVPLLGADDLMGFVCLQSEAPDCFGSEFVHAVEYLARMLYRQLRHTDETEADLALLERYPQIDPHRVIGVEPAVEVEARMSRLRRLAGDINGAAQRGDLAHVTRLSSRLTALCERYESELVLALSSGADAHPSWGALTDRQRQVAELVQRGMTNEQVAQELVLSVGTVKSHVSEILRRLQLSSRRELMRAYRMVRPDSSSA